MSEKGLTIVEIIVVLIILAVVMSFVGGRILGAGDRAKADLTRLKLQEVRQSIEQFQLRYNTLPAGLEGLIRCTEQTGPGCVPILGEDSLRDGWGNAFIYNLQDGGRRYRVISLGADGREGGEGVDFDITLDGP
jgi:general secretion pathway protein G